MIKIKKIAIFPFAENSSNPYQELFIKGFESIGVEVFLPKYKNPFPLLQAIRQSSDCDAIILDWVHTFYTSKNLFSTLVKTVTGELERIMISNRNIPIIWNLHNLHRHDKLFIKFEEWSFKRLGDVVDGIRVFNDYSKEVVIKHFSLEEKNKIWSIPHGNYFDVYKNIKTGNLRASWGIKSDDIVLLLFGGLREGKGIPSFLKAFSSLDRDNIKLVIAGKPENDNMHSLINEKAEENKNIIKYLRYIEDDEVPSLFNSSNFAILPYKHILNSGASILALSFGTPIIANSIASLSNVLEPNYSYLEDLHSPHGLNSICQKIESERDQYQEMKNAALEKANSLSWENIAEELIEFITYVKK